MIVLTDRNGAIGAGGTQPLFIAADLARFKNLTMGHAVIMGRKTFESIGKPLPGRANIVLTRKTPVYLKGRGHKQRSLFVQDPLSALEVAEGLGCSEAFIIGGGEMYELFLPYATNIYMTEVDTQFKGVDTWFPKLNGRDWTQEDAEEPILDISSGLYYQNSVITRRTNR